MIKETIFCFLFQFSLFKYWFSVAPVVLQDLNSCITHRLLKLYFNIADVAELSRALDIRLSNIDVVVYQRCRVESHRGRTKNVGSKI